LETNKNQRIFALSQTQTLNDWHEIVDGQQEARRERDMQDYRMRRLRAVSIFALLAGLTALASAASAVEREGLIRLGQEEYMAACASCHGKDGRGGGPVAEVLRQEPTDLTQLTKEYNGQFPRENLYRVIDGRQMINPHGSRQMPVWGWRFQAEARETLQQVPHAWPDARALVIGRITAIVAYIESIQEE
jgi:mono/diheme cytochrome c family protein